MKSRFEVKEKVLCYEPDQNKAKVLYDATIVEVDEKINSEKIGYLVHFKDWSKAYDRWVSLDFLLKVTEESRSKQIELTEELVRNSNERQLKHIPGMKQVREAIKRKEKAKNDPRRPQAAHSESCSESIDGDDEMMGSVSSDDETDLYIPLPLPEQLIFHLEEDYVKIKQKKKLIKLPAAMNVVQILENFVRHFAANMENVPMIVSEMRTDNIVDMGQYQLELIMEVVDDLRILFDHMLPLILLYDPEQNQYKRLIENATLNSQNTLASPEQVIKEENTSPPMARKRFKTADADLLEYNKKYILRDEDLKRTGSLKCEDGTRRSSRSSTVIQSKGTRGVQTAQKSQKPQELIAAAKRENEKRVTRRQQLSSDCCIDLNPKIFVRRTSLTQPKKKEMEIKSEKDVRVENETEKSSSELESPNLPLVEQLTPNQFADANEIRRTMSLSTIWKWRMLPQEYKPPVVPPSLIFGAQHLLRLFVKLPEILARMKIEKQRLEMLTRTLTGFLQFLVTYEKDLFEELAYEAYSDI